MRVLIVEDGAHQNWGHFPVMFRELALTLVEIGCEVTVLTPSGWALEDTSGPQPFEVRSLDRFTLVVYGVGDVFDRSRHRQIRRLGTVWRNAIMTVAARTVRRGLGGADAIVTSHGFNPLIWAALSGPGRSICYQFHRPVASPRPLLASALRAERRRNRVGDRVRIAANSDKIMLGWAEVAPWLEPLRLPFAASQTVEREPDARRLLGLDDGVRLALLFGANHDDKDHEVVWTTFRDLAEWRLIIAGGGAAEGYRRWREQIGPIAFEPLCYDGYVSNELRHLLYSAADLVVLSFRPGHHRDSATLAEAIAYGLPVVCSDQCFAGDEAARLRLGSLFASGDAQSLAAGVRSAPAILDPEIVACARSETSTQRRSTLHLEALDRPTLRARSGPEP